MTLPEIEELADAIAQRMDGHSGVVFVRPNVSFACIAAAPRRLSVQGRSGLAVLAQGSKRLHLGDRSYWSGGSEYLVSTAPYVSEVEVVESGSRRPLLGMTVALDWTRIGRLLLEMQHDDDGARPQQEPWASGQIDRSLARALLHIAQLACSDEAWEVLGEGALRELYYWALRSETGRLLRHRVARGAALDGVTRAVRFVEAHLGERLHVSAIAKVAGMSPSGLHARFSQVLGESPMQYVKRMRLETARRRIAGGVSVTTAALDVGYVSPNQFSREFRRQFGVAPSQLRRARINGSSATRGAHGSALSDLRED